jgi:hypothetical protein
MDCDILCPPHQFVRQRPMQQLAPETIARSPDDDLRDVLEFRKAQQFCRQI